MTCQLNSSHPTGARDITFDRVVELAGGRRIINLDNVRKDKRSVARLLTALDGAEYHIGPDSGISWAAISVGCPVRLVLPDYMKLTQKEQMMHECAKHLMSIQENVEFIPCES